MVWHEIWLPLQSGELLHNSHFLGQPWRTMMKENSWSGHNLQKCNWLEGEMTRCVIYTTMSGLWPVVWLMVGNLDEIWLETLWLQNLGKKCDEPLWIGKKCKDICVPYECSPTSDISKGKKKSHFLGFQGGAVVKNLPASAEDIKDVGPIPGLEDPLEKEMVCIPVFLPGESHWHRILDGCSCVWLTTQLTELGMTDVT